MKNKKLKLDIDELSNFDKADEDQIFDLSDESITEEISKIKKKKIDTLEIYKLLVDTRKFEIDNFWKRTVFFWGTIAILLAGYFSAKTSINYLIFVSYLGFFYNIIFSFSLRGSKYWQVHWETASVIYEKQLKFKLYSWRLKKQIYEDNKNVFYLLRPHKISVSKLTMILSDITILLWLILIMKDWNYLLSKNLLHFQFSWHSTFHPFTFVVIIVPLVCISYLVVFFAYKSKKNLKL
jgi:hypothetical protein